MVILLGMSFLSPMAVIIYTTIQEIERAIQLAKEGGYLIQTGKIAAMQSLRKRAK